MEKLEFKGCLLTGKKAGITKTYIEQISELVQVRINSNLKQQTIVECVLRFESDKSRAREYREYRVCKDVFDTAIEYLTNTATSILI